MSRIPPIQQTPKLEMLHGLLNAAQENVALLSEENRALNEELGKLRRKVHYQARKLAELGVREIPEDL
jgi:predicted nuclease with TOPRIM domain